MVPAQRFLPCLREKNRLRKVHFLPFARRSPEHVNERVREIGVRRALGAKRVDILVQILAESMTLAVMGGVVGMVASVGLIKILQTIVVDANRPELSPIALAIGVLSSGAVGVIAGLYPAIRASLLNPTEALRTE